MMTMNLSAGACLPWPSNTLQQYSLVDEVFVWLVQLRQDIDPEESRVGSHSVVQALDGISGLGEEAHVQPVRARVDDSRGELSVAIHGIVGPVAMQPGSKVS